MEVTSRPKKLKVPKEYKSTHVQAMDLNGDWYLVPIIMLINASKDDKYACWLYKTNGELFLSSSFELCKRHFGL